MQSSKWNHYADWSAQELDARRQLAHTLSKSLYAIGQKDLAEQYEQIEIETMIMWVVKEAEENHTSESS